MKLRKGGSDKTREKNVASLRRAGFKATKAKQIAKRVASTSRGKGKKR